ncbi:MAG: 30S ribosomal protein S13 [Spirochaetia bacterium]|nr:30S ribosomal protein S13 [Spirochaetia bacterium]
MPRIAGVDLPNKRIEVALTYIYGIGQSRAKDIVEKTKVNPNTRANSLSEQDVNAIRKAIESDFQVEGELRTKVNLSIKRLVELNCYRGIRHRLGLPVRGQRTKTNARTRKGKAKTVANKKIVRK